MRKRIRKIPFENQLYLLQLFSITMTVLICAIVSLFININSQIKIVDDNLKSTAQTLSISPSVVTAMTFGYSTDTCSYFLDNLLRGMDFIDSIELITNDGYCIYHSNHNLVTAQLPDHLPDTSISDSSTPVTLETRIRSNQKYRIASCPVIDNRGNASGYIIVSMMYKQMYTSLWSSIPAYITATIFLLIAGYVLAHMLLKLFRHTLRGYNSEQFIQIFEGTSNILNNIDEGVLAINTDGFITTLNRLGQNILEMEPIPYGRMHIRDVLPDSCLPDVLETEHAHYNEHIVIHGKNLLATHLPLYQDGKLIGAASLFHSARLINEMAEQLENANSMVDTLRAFNHEFMNKLHVILGYLETEHIAEAKEYLLQSSMSASRVISQISRTISHQGVAAIIIGKVIRASELNISLSLVPESYCTQLTIGASPNTYVTILGNLLQNAIEELNSCSRPVKEIELTLYIDENSTYISVLDTGRGIPDSMISQITTRGVSTKGADRGTGLYLIESLVENLNGTMKIESEAEEGTVITIMFQKITPKRNASGNSSDNR